MAWVAVLMGSESDWPTMRSCTEVLDSLGVECEVRVTSAHRTPAATAEYVAGAVDRDCRVFVCAAGLAAHLAGAVAAHTTRPVIGVPIDGGPFNGADSLLSTVMMPGGVPVATVAVGKAGAKNAGYLAAQMLARRGRWPGGADRRRPGGQRRQGRSAERIGAALALLTRTRQAENLPCQRTRRPGWSRRPQVLHRGGVVAHASEGVWGPRLRSLQRRGGGPGARHQGSGCRQGIDRGCRRRRARLPKNWMPRKPMRRRASVPVGRAPSPGWFATRGFRRGSPAVATRWRSGSPITPRRGHWPRASAGRSCRHRPTAAVWPRR